MLHGTENSKHSSSGEPGPELRGALSSSSLEFQTPLRWSRAETLEKLISPSSEPWLKVDSVWGFQILISRLCPQIPSHCSRAQLSFGMGQTPDLRGEERGKAGREQRGAESLKEPGHTAPVPRLLSHLKTLATDLAGWTNTSLSALRLEHTSKRRPHSGVPTAVLESLSCSLDSRALCSRNSVMMQAEGGCVLLLPLVAHGVSKRTQLGQNSQRAAKTGSS